MRLVLLLAMLPALLISCGRAAAPDPPPAQAQTVSNGPVRLSAGLDLDAITPAGRIALTLELTAPASAGAALPQAPDELGGLTVVERHESGAVLTESGLRSTAVMILEPFLDGEYTIPPITVAFTGEDGAPGAVSTRPMTVRVRSVLPADQTGLADIGPLREAAPAREPPGSRVLAWGILAAAAVPAIAVLAFFALRRRGGADGRAACAARLRELAESALGEPGAIREAASESARLVRAVLARVIDPAAPGLTGEELLQSRAVQERLSAADRSRLRAALDRADKVIFARAPITEAEAREMLRLIAEVAERMAVALPAATAIPRAAPRQVGGPA